MWFDETKEFLRLIALSEPEMQVFAFFSGNKPVSPHEDFYSIIIQTWNGQLKIQTETECCEHTWFVGSDTEWPKDLVHNKLIPYENYKQPRLLSAELFDRFLFRFRTTKGDISFRMTTDGGQSGCYSGKFSIDYTSNGTKMWNFNK